MSVLPINNSEEAMGLGTQLYLEIKQQILKQIEGIPANSPIPSERELASMFHASRMTVRNDVNELVKEGFLYRNKNKGTFVADRSLLKKNTAQESLMTQKNKDYKLIYFNIKEIPEVAPELNLLRHNPILRVVRVMLEEGNPVTVEEIYFPFEKVQSVAMQELSELLNMERYAAEGTTTQKFIPMLIPEKYSNQLNVKMGTPIIMVETVIHDKEGTPLVLIKAFHNPYKKSLEITS